MSGYLHQRPPSAITLQARTVGLHPKGGPYFIYDADMKNFGARAPWNEAFLSFFRPSKYTGVL